MSTRHRPYRSGNINLLKLSHYRVSLGPAVKVKLVSYIEWVAFPFSFGFSEQPEWVKTELVFCWIIQNITALIKEKLSSSELIAVKENATVTNLGVSEGKLEVRYL